MNKNKIAIITGVSRLKGIGHAIAIELAEKGTDIFFTYWTEYDNQMAWKVGEDEPKIIKEKVEALGVNCASMELDLTGEHAVEALLGVVEKRMGAPSILINNATYSTMTGIADFSGKELDKHYHLNVRATTLLTIEFIRRFQYKEGGRIINMTSGQSLGEMNNEIAYAMTKGAIETLTRTISQEIAAKGIAINAVNPGPTDTGWIDEDLQKDLLERFPMGRLGMPKDAAKLIGFLCSEEGQWITGQVMHSEGGFIRSI